MSALSNVHQVGGTLEVHGMTRLKNLDDLANIDSVLAFLWIRSNDSLNDISGLAQVDTVGRNLDVTNNPFLDDCCVLEDIIPDKIFGDINIYNNAPGCNSQEEITGPLSFTCPTGTVKFDLDPGQCAIYTVPDDTLDPASDNYWEGTNDFNGLSTLQGETFPKGKTTVTWSVSDKCGHTGTCTFNVRVRDREAPVFLNCPPNANYVLPFGATGQVHTWPALEAVDNCTRKKKIVIDVFPLSGSTFSLGTTTVNATATDKAGNVGPCAFDVTVTENCGALPAGMSSEDIGNTGGVIGKNCYDPTHGSYEILTSGSGIGAYSDGFHFISLSSNDAATDIIARILVNSPKPKALVGVMIRQNNADNAASVSTLLKGNNASLMVNRPSTGGYALGTNGPTLSGPAYWVRLQKIGSVYYSSVSTDGSTWTQINQQAAGISGSYLVGIAASITTPGQTAQFEVDNVSVNGTAYRLGSDAMNPFAIIASPNPFGDQLAFQVEGVAVGTHYQVSLLDLTGRVITAVETLESNVSTAVINTQEIAAGIYFLEVQTADARKRIKVVKI